jgi:hypothetical protein
MPFPPYELNSELSALQRASIQRNYDDFGARVRQEGTVRFLIDGTPGYGHQSATVALVRRFATARDASGYGVGFTGTIEIYGYLDETAHDETITLRQKIYNLIPELNGQANGTLYGATVSLKELGTDIPGAVVTYGFSGGYDLLNTLPNEYNSLKTRYFLIIQPYKYDKVIPPTAKPGNVIFRANQGKYVGPLVIDQEFIGNQANPFYVDLFNRAFYIPIFELAEASWKYYYDNSPQQTKNVLEVLRYLSRYFQNPFSFGIIYGVNYPSVSVFRDPAWDRLALAVASLWQARYLDPQATKPPILIHFGAYNPTANVDAGFSNIRELALGQFTPREIGAADSLAAARRGEINLNGPTRERYTATVRTADARRASFRSGVQDTDRYRFVDAGTIVDPATALGPDLAWLNGNSPRVLFVQAGFVPPPVFNYYMSHIDIPAIFEGPNTAVVAINAGCSYLNSDTIGHVGSGRVRYPSGTVDGADATSSAGMLQFYANQIQADFGAWSLVLSEAASEEIGGFINIVQNPEDSSRQYFGAVHDYYRDVTNDKFTIAAGLVEGIVQNTQVFVLASVAGGPPADLDALYTLLQELIAKSTSVDVLTDVFPSGNIHDAYTTLLKTVGGKLIVDDAKVTKQTGDGGATSSVTLTGTSTAFLVKTDAILVFTAPLDAIYADTGFSHELPWSLDGAPWIVFGKPVFHMTASAAGFPPALAISTTIPFADLDVTVKFPYGGGALTVVGTFEPAKTIANFMSLVGGVDLLGWLPQAVQNLAGIGVQRLEVDYDPTAKRVSEIALTIGTTSSWPLINNLSIKSTTALIKVGNPADLTNRQISSSVTGILIVNDKAESGIEISAQFPAMAFSGQLYGSSLSVDDVIAVFWPGGQPGWPGGKTPQITVFTINYNSTTGAYSGNVALDLGWPVTILGKTILTIENVALMVDGGSGGATGSLSGSFIVLPDSAKIGMTLAAFYLGSGQGWKFQAQQTSGVISLSDLVKEYLGWNSGLVLDIDGLSITVETRGPSFEFTAKTAGAWQIPIPLGSGISITGSVTVGYNGGSAAMDGPGARLGVAEVPVAASAGLPALAGSTAAATGYYAKVTADIVWENIELTITANLSQSSYQYIIAWGKFTGILDTAKKTVTIPFTEGTKIGSMVETFVSWLTGSPFGLVAPWSLLNEIPLNNFGLTWDFGKGTVSFTLGIGPIDLGIARIEGISLTYQTKDDPDTKKKRGANIELTGRFFWQQDQSAPLGWNAADPSSTPSAPGQGNKYLDLRLLTAGQHVALPTVITAPTVQKAIEEMGKLQPPESGHVPSIGFDPSINWVFGTDFGVLLIDDKKPSPPAIAGDSPGARAPQAKPSYVVTLQIVFDDPVLYGLRLALEGEAAKVFKGLDFQIMYRKLSDTLGVYQAEITLPELMRRIDVGAYTITLPTFGVQIYTNGDFQFDIGFPWNQNFSRSFTVEAIIPPGIPMVGSGGFYFGKLPAVAVSQLPVATNGSFNPNLVLGFGAQLGFGKSIEYGILKAGFSLTLFGIVQGVLAKWNPYDGASTGGGGALTLQGQYFFWLEGTFGILGRIYGSVDFVVVKASVDIRLEVYAQITYASYEKIPITVYASVEATASLDINLGLFSITIHFSFSVRIKETIVIGALQNPGDAPWKVASHSDGGRLLAAKEARLTDFLVGPQFLAAAPLNPQWDHLQASSPVALLTGYLGFALAIAGDGAFGGTQPDPSKQLPCYIATLAIETTPPASPGDRSGAKKAAGEIDDTPFEALAKMAARWAIAAIQDSPQPPSQVDGLTVTADQLSAFLNWLANPPGGGPPIPTGAIEAFLAGQFSMTVSMPASGKYTAAFFPMALPLALNVPAYGGSQALNYTFAGYNSVADDFLAWLREYFDQLAVQVQHEQDTPSLLATRAVNDTVSVGNFIFSDYFTLIVRQMIQALADGLRSFLYELKSGDTPNGIVKWANNTGDLVKAGHPVSLYDLFQSNDNVALTPGKGLILPFVSYVIHDGDSFQKIAAQTIYGDAFTATQLATANADTSGILAAGAEITYGGNKYPVSGAASLSTLAKAIGVALDKLLSDSDVLTSTTVLQPAAAMGLPPFTYQTKSSDTLLSVAAQHGISVKDLAGVNRPGNPNPLPNAAGIKNGYVADLFDASSSPDIHITHLVQFRVGDLIAESQRAGALQHLSGMVSRYYFHGLRLPTDKITPLKPGMWVTPQLTLPPEAGLFALTGQQFPIPALAAGTSLTITLSRPPVTNRNDPLPWLKFAGGGNSIAFTVVPPDPKVKDDKGDFNYRCYAALKAYATTTVLDSQLLSLGAGDTIQSSAMRYPLSSAIPWQSAAAINFPTGGTPATAQPRLWPLPTAMTSLPNPAAGSGANDPGFSLQVQRYDEASGASTTTALGYFGWASSVQFTVKKLLTVTAAASAAYGTTYEISGASAENTLVLERIVQRVQNNDNAFAALILGYQAPGGAGSALTADTSPTVTFGISQVNLSTVTRPSTSLLAMFEGAPQDAAKPTLLNKPSQFVRLLWEACITRAGGFYLYFVDATTGEGLPDSIFNDKGEATVTLIALYPSGQLLAPFVNAVATGDPLDLSNSSVLAVTASRSVAHTVTATDSLQTIADSVFSTVLATVKANPTLAFAADASVLLPTGTYMVSPTGAQPGGSLAAIAAYFAMTPNAIMATNPRIPGADWQSGLKPFTAIRLPATTLVIGTSPGGNTLQGLAQFYGTTATSLAGYNAATPGLLARGQMLALTVGPIAELGSKTLAVQAIYASRKALPTIPGDPGDAGYAAAVLLNRYTLLAYQVVSNQDFEQSNLGLPLGPHGKGASATPATKVRFAVSQDGDPLEYGGSIAYLGRVIGKPTSPYGGNGRLLQLAYDWNDLYGNRLVTDLDVTTSRFGQNNQSPVLVGYTDAIVALPQWPSISGAWAVAASQEGTGYFTISVDLSFDPDPFNPKSEDTQNPPAWQTRAQASLATINRMIAQFSDPNGIAFALSTTLLRDALPIPASEIGTTTSPPSTLVGWLVPIQTFLSQRANGNTSAPVPSALKFSFSVDAAKSAVTSHQVFALSLALQIERPNGIVEAAFAALPGIRSVSSVVPPKTDAMTAVDALSGFATAIRDNLSVAGQYTLNVATGVNRDAALEAEAAVWGVRFGAPGTGQGISFSINDAGTPEIYAPRPISNQLVTRSVMVHGYTQIADFDPKTNSLVGPSQTLTFSDIDVDTWVVQFFQSFDELLSPVFVSSMLVIDKRATNLPQGVPSLLQALADAKELLAVSGAALMAAVFDKQPQTRLASAGEALRQEMLTKLSNLYTTRAAVSFGATVSADIHDGGDPRTPGPALFGNVTWPAADPNIRNQVTFSSPKLPLTDGDNQPVTFLIEAPQLVNEGSAGIVDRITLNLNYAGSAIEHQVAEVPGITGGYFASSWLIPVLSDAMAPLMASLGTFDLPMILRGFPNTPQMNTQLGAATSPGSKNLDDLTLWTYSFSYGLGYHYEQDTIYCLVEYNIADVNTLALAGLLDAFGQLAQFLVASPALVTLLQQTVPTITAQTTDQKKIDDAAQVVGAYVKIASDVANAAKMSGGLPLHPFAALEHGTDPLPYRFHIVEASKTFQNDQGQTITAYVITIVSDNGPPSGLGDNPYVLIDDPSIVSRQYITALSNPTTGVYAYYYQTSDGPLTGDKAQAISARRVCLPGLQILARQDAKTTVHLTRNEDLVPGKATARPFVYQTPNVSFANPFHPTIASNTPVNIATLGTPEGNPVSRSLDAHLTALFAALFENRFAGDVTLQVEISYAYALASTLGSLSVPLPVALQPPLWVKVGDTGSASTALATMIADLSAATRHWFTSYAPSLLLGVLNFDVKIMSNLTKQPMPLLELTALTLPVQYIAPALLAIAAE